MTFPALVFICLILLLLFGIVVGIAKIFRFVYREMGAIAVLILLGLSVGTPWLAWHRFAYRHALSHVPAGLEVTVLTFEATEAMGFGPGGSEEGLLVYELPEASARRVAREGASWLNSLRDPAARNSQADYSDWEPTPASGRGLPLDERVCVYDECSEVPPGVRQRVNDIIARPGAYAAHRRSGKTIVVSPEERLVIVRYGK